MIVIAFDRSVSGPGSFQACGNGLGHASFADGSRNGTATRMNGAAACRHTQRLQGQKRVEDLNARSLCGLRYQGACCALS